MNYIEGDDVTQDVTQGESQGVTQDNTCMSSAPC